MKLGQKGFTLIEGLLVLIALSLVVGTGYYVYNANNKAAEDLSASQKAAATAPKATSENNSKYLEIKEAGVKFKLNSLIDDAYYAVNPDGYVYLSTHYFDSLKGFEGCKAAPDGAGGVVALIVAKVGDKDDIGNVWTPESLKTAGLKKIDDTYYAFQRGNTPCYDKRTVPENSKELQKLAAIRAAFYKQEDTITKL